uniref:3-oxo-5alpha-steroid 4-dehydrogenase (NADP(+)) n=1 Tax=Oryzias latipes TaxID=8090 RepID=A0A3P9MQ02_ORYLA
MTSCRDSAVFYLSWTLLLGGAALFWRQRRACALYGRYAPGQAQGRCYPAGLAWFLQEVPALLTPLLLLLWSGTGFETGTLLLLGTFVLHYGYRSLIYAFLTRGRPVPLHIIVFSATFCGLNGVLQGHHLLHCAHFDHTWMTRTRLAAGCFLFLVGLSINVHSDFILRGLRKPGEHVYRIPRGGLFELVSGANFLGEILEWCGYAIAAGTLPAFAWAFFTVCSIGPRAVHHHRDYRQRFEDYPPSRKAIIPFLL